MAATRNRLSMAGAGGTALLESLDAFKKKHSTQNQQIIRRNSELMTVNTEINQQLIELQQEVMQLKGENLRLSGQLLQQDLQMAHLKQLLSAEQARVQQLEEGGASGPSKEQIETIRQAMETITAEAQNVARFLRFPLTPTDPSNRTPKGSFGSLDTCSLASYTSESLTATGNSIKPTPTPTAQQLARRMSAANPRVALVTEPDLSFIDEGMSEMTISGDKSAEPVHGAPSRSPSPPPLIKKALQDRAHQSDITARRRSGMLSSISSMESLGSEPSNSSANLFELGAISPQSFSLRHSDTQSSRPPETTRPLPAAPPAKSTENLLENMDDCPTVSQRRKRFKPKPSIVASMLDSGTGVTQGPSEPPETSDTNGGRTPSLSRPEGPDSTNAGLEEATDVPSKTKSQGRKTREPLQEVPQNARGANSASEGDRVQEKPKGKSRRTTVGAAKASEASERVASPIEPPDEPQPEEESAVGRRSRKSVNYALPNLRDKMRQPAGYVPTIKRAARLSHSVAHSQATELSGPSVAPRVSGKRLSSTEEEREV